MNPFVYQYPTTPSLQQPNANMMMHMNNTTFFPQDGIHLQPNTYPTPVHAQTSSRVFPQANISTNANEDLIMRKKHEQKRRFQQHKHTDANSLMQAMFEDLQIQKSTNEMKKPTQVPQTGLINEELTKQDLCQTQDHQLKQHTSQPLPELSGVISKCSDLRQTVKLLPNQSTANTTLSSPQESYSQTKLFQSSERAADWSHVNEDINDLFVTTASNEVVLSPNSSNTQFNFQVQSDSSTVLPNSFQTANSQLSVNNNHFNAVSSFPQPITSQSQFHYPSWCYDDDHLPVVYQHVFEASYVDNCIQTHLLYPILLLSGLSKEKLSYIWSSVNCHLPGQLIKEELYCALAMIGLAQQNINDIIFDHLYHLQQIPIPYFHLPNSQQEKPPLVEQKEDSPREEPQQDSEVPVSIEKSLPSTITVNMTNIIPVTTSNKDDFGGFQEFIDEREATTVSSVIDDDKYSLFKQNNSVISSGDPYCLFKLSQTPTQLSKNVVDDQNKQFTIISSANNSIDIHQDSYSLFEPQEKISVKIEDDLSNNKMESDPYAAFREGQQQEIIEIDKSDNISWLESENETIDTTDRDAPLHQEEETNNTLVNSLKPNLFIQDIIKSEPHSLSDSNNKSNSFSNVAAASVSTFFYEPPELITTNSNNEEEEDYIPFQHNHDEEDEDNYLPSIDKQQPSFLNASVNNQSSDTQSIASLDLPHNSTIQKIREDDRNNVVDTASSMTNINDDNRSISSQTSEIIKQQPKEDDVAHKLTTWSFSSYENYDMTLDNNDDGSPAKVWLPCLQKCRSVLSRANEIFSSIKSSSLCVEILQNSRTIDYVYQLQEIFYLSKRIIMAIQHYGLITNELNDISKQIIAIWTNLQAFFSNANLQLPNEESISYTSAMCANTNDNDYCHICLISSNIDLLYPSTYLNLFNTSTITFAGRLYHASCANFYINMIDSSLPSLTSSQFS